MKNEILKVRNEFEDLIMDAEKLYSIVFINWDSLASGTFSANNEVYTNAAYAIEGLMADVLRKMNNILNELYESGKNKGVM